jgi:hypothetical protein
MARQRRPYHGNGIKITTSSTRKMSKPTKTTSLLTFPQKVRDQVYDSCLELHLPGRKIASAKALINLHPLFLTKKQMRDELLARVKLTYTIHPLNSVTFKNILKVSLGGTMVRDLGLKTTFIYYEDAKASCNSKHCLPGLELINQDEKRRKQEIVKYFGIRNPGALAAIELQQIGFTRGAERFKVKGQDWEFEILLGQFHDTPTVGAAFTGDLCRLAFFE